MEAVPQIVPISDLRNNQPDILNMLENAPVVLAQRSKPRAVLVSVTQWDTIAAELKRYRAREIAAIRAKELDANPTLAIPFTDDELIKQGVING